ncbi:hypothetical protein ACFE04_010153 [Oxalis oulophora]
MEMQLERGFHGLEKQTVAKFPTKKYSDEFFSKTDDSQYVPKSRVTPVVMNSDIMYAWDRCTVCLADYRNDDLLRILPNCGHSFHMTCIDIWLQQHSTCPVCRISLREFPERRRLMQPLFSSHIRSHYNIETFQIHGPNCPLAGLRLPVRNHNNHGMGPIDDNHCVSENNRTDIRENCVEARVDAKDSRHKHVESPSNP